MKINDPLKNAASLGVKVTPSRTEKAAEQSEVAKTATESVTLSPKAQVLANQSSGAGVFDAEKVERIKAAIASGSFQINVEAIADGLLADAKNFVLSRKE